MSVSQHPIALRLEQQVGGATKLLATVMALPLLDGIFPALVIAGVLASPAGVVETGILIFGGSATVAVILAEMDGTRREMATSVLLIGAFIVPVAAIEAALAPTLADLLNLAVFERFAGLVILAIAAKTASSEIGEYLPSPGVIIGLGLVASFQPSSVSLQLSTEYVAHGAAAAGIGTGFALSVALLSPYLKGRVHIDRFRFGSAVALGVLALPILLGPFDVMQTEAPIALAVLAVTALFAYDPDADNADVLGSEDDDDATAADDAADETADAPDDAPSEPADEEAFDEPREPPERTPISGPGNATVFGASPEADGGEEDSPMAAEDGDDGESRAPWL